jgi:hypothetical protein
MSKTIRIEVPEAKRRNPLVMLGKGSGRQVFGDRRNKRSKDAGRGWQRDYQVNGKRIILSDHSPQKEIAMSPYGKMILELSDQNVTVDLQQVKEEAWLRGFEWRDAKWMCDCLGVGIRGGS